MARKKRKGGRRPQIAHSGAEFQISPAALRLAVPALVAFFSVFAWLERGVHEDGFFYLRVADVFLNSGGLAYNPGERYETNTDFLWSLLLIPGPAAGLDDILWMQIVGVAVYAAALWAAYLLARRLLPDLDGALVALVLLGAHYTFAHFAATGFGVVLQALAALCCLLALFHFGKSPNLRNGAALGFALLFLALCRLDSALFGIPLVLCALFFARQNGGAALPAIVVAMGIPSVLFGGVLLWKLSYYGDIFPATYYTKGAAERAGMDLSDFKLRQGAAYLTAYWREYFLWLIAAAAAFGAWRKGKGKKKSGEVSAPILWTTAAMCALWHGYMLQIGGGYAEFRFMAAQAPMMMILLAWGLSGLARHWRIAAALAAAGVSLAHGLRQEGEIVSGVLRADVMLHTRLDSEMRTELYAPRGFEEHRLLGKGLADLFGKAAPYSPDIRVASAAGGVSAYLSRLEWVETHGYADPRISNADPSDLWLYPNQTLVGHHIVARPKFLARHGVNLVAEPAHIHPRIDFSAPIGGGDPRMTWAAAASASPIGQNLELPPQSQVFALPLEDGRFTPILYLVRNETIDRILDERGIERVNVF